jgi:uncharacterized OB-fold protein
MCQGEVMTDWMVNDSLAHNSPLGIYQAYCQQGHLAYQTTPAGDAIFFPRVVAPQTGQSLSWQISKGHGTVYATTVVHAKDQAPYNVALIDLDEGFRMMSQVHGVAAELVAIGQRVQVWMRKDDDGVTRPYFKPLGAV